LFPVYPIDTGISIYKKENQVSETASLVGFHINKEFEFEFVSLWL